MRKFTGEILLLSAARRRRFGEERKNEGGGIEKGKHRIKIAWLYDSIKKGSG